MNGVVPEGQASEAAQRKMGRDAEADKMEARAQAIRAKHGQEIPQR